MVGGRRKNPFLCEIQAKIRIRFLDFVILFNNARLERETLKQVSARDGNEKEKSALYLLNSEKRQFQPLIFTAVKLCDSKLVKSFNMGVGTIVGLGL